MWRWVAICYHNYNGFMVKMLTRVPNINYTSWDAKVDERKNLRRHIRSVFVF